MFRAINSDFYEETLRPQRKIPRSGIKTLWPSVPSQCTIHICGNKNKLPQNL